MNLKRGFLLALVLCLMLSLCACGGDHIEKTVAPSDEAVIPQETEEATEAPTEAEPEGITYTVTVVDEGGNPVVGTMVQICQGEICLMPTPTDESGVAVFTVETEGAYEAKLLSLPAGYEYATEQQAFPFDTAYELTITLKAVA